MKFSKDYRNNFMIDWLEIFIQDFYDVNSLASFLFYSFGFNVFLREKPRAIKEAFLIKEENLYQVNLTIYSNQFWNGIKLEFSGKNSNYFYFRLKANPIEFFDRPRTKISRLDIKYSRDAKVTDQFEVKSFLENCKTSLIQKSKKLHVSLTRNSRGYILWIGARTSPNYYCIYEDKNCLDFNKFEEILIDYFCHYSRRKLLWDNYFMDWLTVYLRSTPEWTKRSSEYFLVTDYIVPKNLDSKNQNQYFFRLLQFLSFLHTIRGLKKAIDYEQVYCLRL